MYTYIHTYIHTYIYIYIYIYVRFLEPILGRGPRVTGASVTSIITISTMIVCYDY